MALVDNSRFAQRSLPNADALRSGQLVLNALVIAGLVAMVGGLTAYEGTGWAVAADWVTHVSMLVFLAAVTVEPLARLFPSSLTRGWSAERGNLMKAFIAVMAMSLFLTLAPWLFSGVSLPATAYAYCILTGVIVAVMLAIGQPASERQLGGPALRAMHRIATSYFWTVFMLASIDRIYGPHRPDYWPGFALLLLVAVVLLRFADAFREHARIGLAGKVG